MANFKEQLLRIWNEWEDITGEDANNPDDFIDWAIRTWKAKAAPRGSSQDLSQATVVCSATGDEG